MFALRRLYFIRLIDPALGVVSLLVGLLLLRCFRLRVSASNTRALSPAIEVKALRTGTVDVARWPINFLPTLCAVEFHVAASMQSARSKKGWGGAFIWRNPFAAQPQGFGRRYGSHTANPATTDG